MGPGCRAYIFHVQFSVSGDELTSSSVVDIFASLHQTIRVINELNWTDEHRKADFMAEAAVVSRICSHRAEIDVNFCDVCS
jgi:hypothetical protein